MKCKNCAYYRNGWCEKVVDSPDQDMERKCRRFQKKTNADRIRAMSDEELAKWLSICGCPDAFSSVSGCEEGKCEECWMVYLKQPYKEDA